MRAASSFIDRGLDWAKGGAGGVGPVKTGLWWLGPLGSWESYRSGREGGGICEAG